MSFPNRVSIKRVCHISTFSPTQCGIATYTEDLIKYSKNIGVERIRIIHPNENAESSFDGTISLNNLDTYDEAISLINESPSEVVSLQHEFGIYGGLDGEYVQHLISGIRKPIVTTLHTTHEELSSARKDIIAKVASDSTRVVVLSEESKHFLVTQLNITESKITVIRHGISEIEFSLPETIPARNPFQTPLLFVSAGHLRPAKGYDISLKALSQFRSHNPQFKYLILGTNAPHVDKGALAYSVELKNLIKELDLEDHVIQIEKYLSLEDLLTYIAAADIGLATYTRRYQSSSGILSQILGCGRLAIASKFDYANSISKQVKGLYLAEMHDSESVLEKIIEATKSKERMHQQMYSNYLMTRVWLWGAAASSYMQVFSQATG